MTPYQISLNHWDDLEGMNKIMAISECMVHLDYLEDRKIVQKIEICLLVDFSKSRAAHIRV